MNDETKAIALEDEFPRAGDAKPLALALPQQALSCTIVDQPSLERANSLLLGVKHLRLKLDEEFDPNIKKWHEGHKAAVASKRKFTAPLDEAESILRPRIARYLEEQDRIRWEKEQAAERARQAAKEEAVRAAETAMDLAQNGQLEAADEVVERAAERIEKIQTEAPVIPAKPVSPGTYLRETWTYEVVNEALVPREYLMVDKEKLRGYVTYQKENAKVPGVRFFSTKSVSTRLK